MIHKPSLVSKTNLFTGKNSVKVRALLISERIDIRALEVTDYLAILPLMVKAGEHGCAVLFRYGAVVFFDLSPIEEVSFLNYLQPLVGDPFEQPELEEAEVRFDPTKTEWVEHGVIFIHECSLERLQVVADILAKSVILAHYEASIANFFDQIEPLAVSLQRKVRVRPQGNQLLEHIGDTLLIQHKMVGLVEVTEKPETLWERPELERLYLRLEDEYELSERHLALERKLELISRTAETVLDVLQHNSNLRVEWYITILIVVEILLTLYEMFFKLS